MYVCTYIYIHTHTYTHFSMLQYHVLLSLSLPLSLYLSLYIYMYVCMYVCMYVYIYIYIYTCMHCIHTIFMVSFLDHESIHPKRVAVSPLASLLV